MSADREADEPSRRTARSGTGPGRPRRRRDRHGRGLRSALAPPDVPLSRTRADVFEDLVLDAVDDLEEHWPNAFAAVDIAVDEVPPLPDPGGSGVVDDPDLVDDRGVPLGRLLRGPDAGPQPLLVVYRRPIEARTQDRDERADLVFAVVAELVAGYLGKDIDEIDPP